LVAIYEREEIAMGAPLCHFELMTDNPEECKAFYTKVLGWEFADCGMPGYTMIHTGQQPDGGMMERPAQAPRAALNVYFMVEDIAATLSKVEKAGGRVIVPKTPIPNVGSFAMIADPEGIVVGIFQA
jgi:uncharacterized protein